MKKILFTLASLFALSVTAVHAQQPPVVIKFENNIVPSTKGDAPEAKDTKKGKLPVKGKIEVNINQEVHIHLGDKAPKFEPVFLCQPILVHCPKAAVNTVEYIRWTSGRTVVWYVAQPGLKPTTFYPPFTLRAVGKELVAQEQAWNVEYVRSVGGKQTVVWASFMKVKPDAGFKLPAKTACFDVTQAFDGATIKAADPFILFAPADQAWWGTPVPGIGGRLEADVVAGYPLVLRLPCPGQATFEGAGAKQLGPVIVEK